MARAPFQVLVYPYRQRQDCSLEYAILKRADAGFWQGIAGGGEGYETPLEAAKREAFEEAGIGPSADFIQLDAVESVPITAFKDSYLWADDIYVIPQYSFGVFVLDGRLKLSHEHSEYRWLQYDEAYSLIRFDGNKTAFWELDKRLKGLGPRS